MQALKNAAISKMIVAEMSANGGDIVKAFDKVFGEGAYMRLAGEVYHQLRGE
jgi:hypothetical protein